jgi:outer membrane protein assembly factor BamB
MESGDQLWERELPSPFGFGSSAGLAGGSMLTVARSVAALSPASGETIWETPESFGPLQLTVDGDRVYAVGIESEQGVVLAWDAATGEELGRAKVAIESPPNLLGGIAASGDLVALALSDNGLLLVDLGAGELRWRATLPAAAAGPPVIDGDTLRIMTADNHLLGFGAADGELVSDFAIQGAVGEQTLSSMAPLLRDGRLYAAFYQTAFAIQLR